MLLPVHDISDKLNAVLSEHGVAVVCAPPGAGKSTVLPLTMLKAFDSGRILMLEPRRLAAREVASRMASTLGEKVGETVGYRVRFESKVSERTRIEVLTEGILTRMLIDDPTLEGVRAVIFDEFHERSIQSDMALALVRESMTLVRDDLKLVVMSATLDTDSICKSLGAPLVSCEGRMFPVELIWSKTATDTMHIAEDVAHTIRIALQEQKGDILAFLPGEGEIRKCASLLENLSGDVAIRPLYGMMTLSSQHEAISPDPGGHRRVVLSTPIAETSLTIEGVRIVVDSGYFRKAVFDPQSALSRMETRRISRDMATQRMGRAGRTESGVCYRLWDAATHSRMQESRIPEVLDADLTDVCLSAAAWGCGSLSELKWVTPPPQSSAAYARSLLISLGALDENGRISPHGRILSGLPCHPRLAGMLASAKDPSAKALAADVAAIIEDKDPLPDSGSADLGVRVEYLRKCRREGNLRAGWHRIAEAARQYRQMIAAKEDNTPPDSYAVGALISVAYPERIGKAMEGTSGKYLLSNGSIAALPFGDALAGNSLIAASAVGGSGNAAALTCFLAAPLALEDAEKLSAVRENVFWSSAVQKVIARKEWRLGQLTIKEKEMNGDIKPLVYKAISDAALKDGASMFAFSDSLRALQRRIDCVRGWHPELDLPAVDDSYILARTAQWLPMYMEGTLSGSALLKKIDLCKVVHGLLEYPQLAAIEKYAPETVEVPTGSRIKIDYRAGAQAPVLRVRLQECFGLLDTPAIDCGRVRLLMELLSPGFKPVQLTSDLRSFWQTTYFEVRKELRMRYPRHSWPENPLNAQAIRGPVKRK